MAPKNSNLAQSYNIPTPEVLEMSDSSHKIGSPMRNESQVIVDVAPVGDGGLRI
jgi:hypothetical protein